MAKKKHEHLEQRLTSPLNTEHRCQILHCYCKDGRPIEQVVQPHPLKRPPISKTHPEIAKYWDHEKNCGWEPSDFSSGSHVVAWWKCEAAKDHAWTQTINLCARLTGCPFCGGFKLSKETSLANKDPKLAKAWHPTLNTCSPKDIAYNSNYVAWWLCPTCGYEFPMEVRWRQERLFGCRRCAKGEPIDLNLYPGALKLFDKSKNQGIDPSEFGTNTFIWWKCRKAKDHVWQERFEKRTGDKKCPFCAGFRASSSNNLNKMPEIAAQFHPFKNGDASPEDFALNTTKIIWWQCEAAADHTWKQRINIRTQWGYGCPFCANRKVAESNCLKTNFPNVARDWHPKKNRKLTPSDVLPGSARVVWWQCRKCKHEWRRAIYLRTNRQSPCPSCLVKVEGNKRDSKTGQWLPAKKRKSKK